MQKYAKIQYDIVTNLVNGRYPNYINYSNNKDYQLMMQNGNFYEATKSEYDLTLTTQYVVKNGVLEPYSASDADKLVQAKQSAIATLQLNYNNTQNAIIQTNEGQFNISLPGEEWKTEAYIHKHVTDANLFGSASMLNKITGVFVKLTKDDWNNFYDTYNTISNGNLEKKLKTQKEIENATSLTALNKIKINPFSALPVFNISNSV